MNKKGHKQLTLLVAAMSVPALFVFREHTTEVLLFESGVLATLHPYLNPDLDYHHRKWSKPGELLGFEMYSSMIPHRSGMHKRDFKNLNVKTIVRTLTYSHWPLIGTLPRAIIASIPIILFTLMVPSLSKAMASMFLWVWLGMSWSDLWHVVSDKIYSMSKRKRKEVSHGELAGSYWRGRKKYGIKSRRHKRRV